MDGVKLIGRLPDFSGDEARPNPALVATAAALRSLNRPAAYGDLLAWSGCAFELFWLRQPEHWSSFRPAMAQANWQLLTAAVGGGLECLSEEDVARLTEHPAALRTRMLQSIDENRPVLGFAEGGCPYALCVGYRPGDASQNDGLLWRAIFCTDKSRLRSDRLIESSGTPLVFFPDVQQEQPVPTRRLRMALEQSLTKPQVALPAGWSLFAGAEAASRAAEDVRAFSGSDAALTERFSAYCLTVLHEIHDARLEAARVLRESAGEWSAALAQQAGELAATCQEQASRIWATASSWLDFTTQNGLFHAYDRFAHSWTRQRQEEIGDCFTLLAKLEQAKEQTIRAMIQPG